MTDERKLRVVRPEEGKPSPGKDATGLDEAPPSAEELAEAELVREALERGDEPVSSSLRSAQRPASLTDDDHEALLRRALGDPLAPPTAREAELGAQLAALLDGDGPRRPAPEVDDAARVARMLAAAHRPAAVNPLRHEAMLARVLAAPAARRGRGQVVAVVAGVLALAAAAALVFVRREPAPISARAVPTTHVVAAQASLIRVRSTMDLFDPATPFPRTGGESDRIDRIVSARAGDLRQNRWSTWGVP